MSKAVIANNDDGAAATAASPTTHHRHMISGSDSAASLKAPTPRIFKRVPGGNKQDACTGFKEALLLLMSIGGVPADRADLAAGLAQRMQDLDEDDLEAILYAVEIGMASTFFRQRAKGAIAHVTPDEARAVTCLTLETPFPVYKLLNAWLMSGGQRDDAVVDKVGPFFALLYRGLEKLPRLRGVRAQRVVAVGNGSSDSAAAEVRAMFDGHEALCTAGAAIHFWAFSSFARRDAGGDEIAVPSADSATVVYRCDSLECVDVTPFFTVPRDGADGVEVLPLPPLVTTVMSAAMQPGRSKTLVITLQQQSNDGACYVVPRVAAPAPSETPEQLLERGAAAFQANKFADAAAIYTQVIDLCRAAASASADNSDFLKRALLNRSGAYCFLGEHERALSDAQELCTKSHPQLAKGWARCAAALHGLKRYAEAADAYATAAQATDRKGAEEPAVYLQSANEMRALVAAAAFDKTAPLAKVLLQTGLSAHQIVQDGWTALMSLPRDAVRGVDPAAAEMSAATLAALDQHATLDVLKVKPSSPLSCELWCCCVTRFSVGPAGRQRLGVPAVREALLAVRSLATTADAYRWWTWVICNMTSNNDANRQLFGTAAVRDALVALRPQVASSDSCQWWASAVANVTTNSGAVQQLFSTAAVRDVLVAIQPVIKANDSCQWWCTALCNLTANDASKQLFGTVAVRDAIVGLRPHATKPDSCQWWCTAICNLMADSDANKQLFGTAAVRDALVALQPRATTPDASREWCDMLFRLARSDANKPTFGTVAVRDALLALRPRVAAANACQYWCGAVGRLADLDSSRQQLFGTAAVRDALLALRSQVTTAEACQEWTGAICNLTASNPANQQLYATSSVVRDTLVAFHRLATTVEACMWWSKAIWKLAGEAPAHIQQLFGTAAIRDALVAVGSVIARFPVHHVPAAGGACLVWCAAVFALTDKDAANRALFRCDALLKVHAALKNSAATHPEPTHWWTCAGAALQRP